MEYRVLGPLEVRNGEESLPLSGAKQRALLALLLLHANRVLSRDRLIDELWGEAPPATAVQSLQVYVSRLRKLLPDGALATRAPGYLLEVVPEELDLRRFERLLAEGREALEHDDAERAARVLREALELWRGPALAEFAFEPFAQAEIARLEDLRLAAVEERIEADLALGRHADLIGELEALIAENPHRERLRGQLMLALYRSGRQAEALEAYQRARRVLDELGINPGAQLADLERGILRHEPALSAKPTERSVPGSNLPSPPTPLIGRSREVAEARALLRTHRIVTLVGAGGSGKTRLAVAVAEAAAEEFPDGLVWVELQALRDHELVLPAVAQAAGAPRNLAEHLEHRRILLVLDNFEQVVSAAPRIAELSRTAKELKILATSRQPLHLSGEHEYPVFPLEERDAVSLFIERARAVSPEFQASETVALICRRLDCLPLAIELAAARTKLLSPVALLERLDARLPLLTGGPRDAPARQQTLHATIDWSYRLLPKRERLLFSRLAVFSGGFTLEAAECIAAAEMDTLQSLIDKSLVRRHETEFGSRYWMLETIRDFATERLEATTDHEHLGRAHADFFVGFAERFLELRHRRDGPKPQRLRRLLEEVGAEHDNLRAALAWALDREESELAARLFASLHDFWIRRDFLVEGRRWAERVLSVVDAVSPHVRAHAFYAAAQLAFTSGDAAAARPLYERSLEIARELDNEALVAWRLVRLASVDSARGDLLAARRQLEESLRVSRALEDERTTAAVLQNLGEVERDLGNTHRAKQLLVASIELLRAHGTAARLGAALHSLGDVLLDEQAFEEATSYYTESLEIARELDSDRHTAYCLAGLASAAAGEVTRGTPLCFGAP